MAAGRGAMGVVWMLVVGVWAAQNTPTRAAGIEEGVTLATGQAVCEIHEGSTRSDGLVHLPEWSSPNTTYSYYLRPATRLDKMVVRLHMTLTKFVKPSEVRAAKTNVTFNNVTEETWHQLTVKRVSFAGVRELEHYLWYEVSLDHTHPHYVNTGHYQSSWVRPPGHPPGHPPLHAGL
ncbi:hypothetical protein Hamer_G016638 [Homarus americanus]|uniref:Uncharacterized protein n=1 Tax=Homarus americanus TaxID=6706 RepID=A0A8J5JQW7_HOMAM|nr:hypothetical protein Hamer_G016638 [Homarus americanus]